MKKFSCIIVDDESFSIKHLTQHVRAFEKLSLLETFTDPEIALQYILGHNEIDILFTDVDMPNLLGIELAEAVQQNVKHIVFVTSNLKSQIHPTKINKWHYLGKPASFENFKKILHEIV